MGLIIDKPELYHINIKILDHAIQLLRRCRRARV
jgi:hypothetical protein